LYPNDGGLRGGENSKGKTDEEREKNASSI
jgi:hypothetical protein